MSVGNMTEILMTALTSQEARTKEMVKAILSHQYTHITTRAERMLLDEINEAVAQGTTLDTDSPYYFTAPEAS